jgi:hypothetical protein
VRELIPLLFVSTAIAPSVNHDFTPNIVNPLLPKTNPIEEMTIARACAHRTKAQLRLCCALIWNRS